MIPYSDTYMVIGGPTSIYVMRGDPKAGGSIDLISNQVGILGPQSWAQGPDGTIYFMSRHGLYKLQPGGLPDPMTLGRVNQTLAQIDLTVYQFNLAWNGDDDTLWIVAVPLAQGTPQLVMVWDSKLDSFWIDNYPAAMGPACIAAVTGTGGALVGANRRILLVGGWDSYVRTPDANNFNDDGSAINTNIRFAPLKLGDGDSLGKVNAARFEWGMNVGGGFLVNYDYFVANQPQEAANPLAVSAHTGSFTPSGGYQSLDRTRVRGGAFCLQLSKTGALGNTWSFESALLEVTGGGRMRT